MKFLKQFLIIFVSVIVLSELCLRISGKFKTYSETTANTFISPYGQARNSWYYTRQPDTTFTITTDEYSYPFKLNHFGLRTNNYPKLKNDSVARILFFGDSFIEGIGTSQDSALPCLLQNNLRDKGISAEVINAGVAGSDIFYEYVLYRDKLSELNPDIVLVSMNSSDYSDYLVRGGMERFKQDGTVKGVQAPWFETIFKYSHFFRALLITLNSYPYNGILVSNRDLAAISKQNNAFFYSLLAAFNNSSTSKHSKFIFFTYCIPSDIRWPKGINEQNLYNMDELRTILTQNNILTFDISHPIREDFSAKDILQYSYLNDMHYNSKGYSLVAKYLTDSLISNTDISTSTSLLDKK